MFFRMVYDEKLAQAAYLIGCQRTGEAIVIDPERDVDRYERLAAANGLRIVAVAETHIHADFLSGARELAEKGAIAYLSDEGDAEWKYEWVHRRQGSGSYAFRLLRDGDVFSIGNIELRVVHTPGHTPEHICFMVTDRGGGADEPMGVATGDFVFVGDLGRPDLLESAAGFAGKADPSAHELHRTVRRFLDWPDHLQVWPAHGAGSACGKALGAVPQSTVGYEKRFNRSIRAAADEAEFVQFILSGQPEPPLYFARMKRDNKQGPKVLGGVPAPRRLTVDEMMAIDARSTAVIDTRPWAAFREGHLAGALSFPLNKAFPTDAGSMILEGEPIVLVIEPARLDEAVRDLIRVGLDEFVGWLDVADLASLRAAGARFEATREVAVAAARSMLERTPPFVLDVRKASEFAEGRIDGAVNIAHTRLRSRLSEVPKDRPILVNCLGGSRSARATALLQREGYDATNLEGGMTAWMKG
ncbi:MAG TPA: MBL fold metallo-hydrolase [Phycisphaerales bacterium]|nr:MBL fold metallo-hydrolase [Phycisphaerales bacterium]HMP35848.1 MBL fold metallo-hydrolase [Phycisphaerales bacterium]